MSGQHSVLSKGTDSLVTHTTSPSTSVAYTVKGTPKSVARPAHGQNREAAARVGGLAIDLLGGTCADGEGDNAVVGEVAMVCKGVEARAGATNVIGSRSHPGVFAGDVDQLVWVESGEWNVPRSALSLFMMLLYIRRVSLLEMLTQELGILEGSLCIWTEGHAGGR